MKKVIILVALAVSLGNAAAYEGTCGGLLCLSFDDRNFDAWERCLPLFAKYGAHATFFVCGPIDARAEACLKKLSAAGHSVGLHGQRHQRAPQLIAKLGERHDRHNIREVDLERILAAARAAGVAVIGMDGLPHM